MNEVQSAESLIQIKQLPIIENRLRLLKEAWQQQVLDAQAMVCTEESLQTVKKFRTELKKQFDGLETVRKNVKSAIMGPYEAFEEIYRDCVTESFKSAYDALSGKISEVETDIKTRCEAGLREYFEELCAANHLEWLQWEQAEIKVDMASAKSKTPKKLREQIAAFVARVNDSTAMIADMENAEEIMVEFRRTLDASAAIFIVRDRHKRIEAERAFAESRAQVREQEAEAVKRVEALAAPVQVQVPVALLETPPKIFRCTFTVRTTMDKLRKLKEFLNMEGIQYE